MRDLFAASFFSKAVRNKALERNHVCDLPACRQCTSVSSLLTYKAYLSREDTAGQMCSSSHPPAGKRQKDHLCIKAIFKLCC